MLNIVSSLMLLIIKLNNCNEANGTIRSKNGLYSLRFLKLNGDILESEKSVCDHPLTDVVLLKDDSAFCHKCNSWF